MDENGNGLYNVTVRDGLDDGGTPARRVHASSPEEACGQAFASGGWPRGVESPDDLKATPLEPINDAIGGEYDPSS